MNKLLNVTALSGLTLALCAYGVTASIAPAPQDPSDTDPSLGQTNGNLHPQVETAIGMLGEASSLGNGSEDVRVETAVHITNDSAFDRTIRIEWLYSAGGAYNVAGNSGPLLIPAGESRTMGSDPTSAPFKPRPLDTGWATRDTSQAFQGRALIYSDPGGFRGISFNAFRCSGVQTDDSGMCNEIVSIPVYKLRNGGIARQAGD